MPQEEEKRLPNYNLNKLIKKLNYKWVTKNIPFFFFLAFIAIIYIYNGHRSDKLVMEIAKTEKNIKELEYEYKSVKSEVIFRSKASELVNIVEPLGLKETKKPPVILYVDEDLEN